MDEIERMEKLLDIITISYVLGGALMGVILLAF